VLSTSDWSVDYYCGHAHMPTKRRYYNTHYCYVYYYYMQYYYYTMFRKKTIFALFVIVFAKL